MRISDVGIIELEGMEFHAYHGCHEQEKTEGNLFVVDFKGCYAYKKAAKSDRLEDAADYGGIYDIVRREMEIRSNLIENVAWRMANAIRETFPEFEEFSVRVSKQNPPVDGPCEWSRFTLRYPADTLLDIKHPVRNVL